MSGSLDDSSSTDRYQLERRRIIEGQPIGV